MLKLAMYEIRNFRGLFMYAYTIMKVEPLKLKKPNTIMFLCDYEIPDSEELRLYISYFAQMPDHNYGSTLTSYKHLPIKEPSVPGNANTSNNLSEKLII